ncbi:uncharacterized protein LOC123896829 [Trifolium pratense]|uniref:uncharacterized protein LOC123896829 n=1 Tax=Trifolium pratense TaxID=57577 RepID=UPI001E6976FC|nr:uncharacterized protein LOC123896829 [Trifolium pratense]
MSTECDTSSLFGVIRPPPPPENLEERGKRPKSEPEAEPEPEEKQKPKWKPREKAAWELKALKDLTLSDFSMYDEDVEPFMFGCAKFVYKNKAMINQEKEIKDAMADHVKRSRNLSPFDAITPPKVTTKFGICWPAVPLNMTDDLRLELTPLCNAALDKFNADNQDTNYVFVDVVKTTWRPGGVYYITFQAQNDSPNCPVDTFQARVVKMRTGPHAVTSCSIKI